MLKDFSFTAIAEYDTELRRLATHCAFGDYLSEAICDHILCGLRSKHIQKRLLAETDLTLVKTMEIARSMEAADRNAQKLKGNEQNLRVSEISLETHKPFYRCGSEQHGPRACPYREAECQNCKEKGHLARMCQSKSRTVHKTPSQVRANPSRKGGSTGTTKRETNWLTVTKETQAEPEPFPDSTILNIGSHRDTPIMVQLKLNEQEVIMEVDTGAAVTLISEEAQKKLFSKANLSKATVKLQTYTAEPLHVLGILEVQVRYGNCVGKHNLCVIKGNGPSLFGRDWLSKIRLDWQNLGVTNNIQSKPLCLQAVLDK